MLPSQTAAVAKHFDDINEDQFDFHGYCLRKVTLRSYVDVLRFEDQVYGEEYFRRAASGLIRIYLHLFDHPPVDETAEPDYSNMTAAERKKAKAIARKKKKAAEKKEAESKDASNKKSSSDNGSTKHTNHNKGSKQVVVDPDPLGKELLKKDPVEEAKKYSSMLAQYAPRRVETWTLRYDVAIRRKKALMALQALHKARLIDPANPELFSRTVAFAGKVEDLKAELPALVQTVLAEETSSILNGKSVADFVRERAAAVRDADAASAASSLPIRIAVAKGLVDAKSASVPDACSLILKGGLESREVTAGTCRDALASLKSFGADAEGAASQWAEAVKVRFPLLDLSAC